MLAFICFICVSLTICEVPLSTSVGYVVPGFLDAPSDTGPTPRAQASETSVSH